MRFGFSRVTSLAAISILTFCISRASVVEIGGTISSDTTWTAYDTIRVVSNLDVKAGAVLTIEEGAVVLVDLYKIFYIYGSLYAVGEPGNIISFAGSAILDGGTPVPGDWFGLWAQSGSTARLEHCEVSGGYYGISAAGAALHMADCLVSDFTSTGIGVTGREGDSDLVVRIERCRVEQQDPSLQGIGMGIRATYPMSIIITQTTISHCNYGAAMNGCSHGAPSFQITNCEIRDNDSCGVYAYTGT